MKRLKSEQKVASNDVHDIKVAQLKDMGIMESDEVLRELLQEANGVVERAVNDYFEKGVTKKIPSSSSSRSSSSSSSSRSSSSSSALYFIGRRNVMGYTLEKGYGLRSYEMTLVLDNIKDGVSGGGHNTASITSFSNDANLSFKDTRFTSKKKGTLANFVAAQLKFICTSENKDAGIKGRLPNQICSFLIPLMRRELITVKGHVAYDVGDVGNFTDVPISVQVFARPDLMTFCSENYIAESTQKKHEREEISALVTDLFIWLLHGM